MRPIDADEFRDHLNDEYEMGVSDLMEAVDTALEATPTLDYAPVVNAHWEEYPEMGDCRCNYYRCSRCRRMVSVPHGSSLEASYPYCNCGARMNEPIDANDKEDD